MTEGPSDEAMFKRATSTDALGTGDNVSASRCHPNIHAPTIPALEQHQRQSGPAADLLSSSSFLYPSPLEVALAQTTLYTNFLMPSPAIPASVPFDAIVTSPFVGASMAQNSFFDDLETGMGGDFALFDNLSIPTDDLSISTSQATPSVQNISTPILPATGTPLIPLHATPIVPALSYFSDYRKVSVSIEDLHTLLQLANSGTANRNGNTSVSSSAALSAAARTTDFRHRAGGKVQKQISKLYTCTIDGCGQQFTRNFNLRMHELTHEEDRARNFVCPELDCGKTFVRVHDLNRHVVTHDQSLWHYCSGCNRGFARIDSLHRHERTGSVACKKG
ncbi:hypothetical protein HDU82_005033 [Entophlyctis luteolus]|nr:hypothetical protein HDU82_005033 [Entophlyctis luteolus]KAJ3379893.1 hypothetical protein HDU84_006328 [Entophlyctis sp. JEL0112]